MKKIGSLFFVIAVFFWGTVRADLILKSGDGAPPSSVSYGSWTWNLNPLTYGTEGLDVYHYPGMVKTSITPVSDPGFKWDPSRPNPSTEYYLSNQNYIYVDLPKETKALSFSGSVSGSGGWDIWVYAQDDSGKIFKKEITGGDNYGWCSINVTSCTEHIIGLDICPEPPWGIAELKYSTEHFGCPDIPAPPAFALLGLAMGGFSFLKFRLKKS